MNDQIQSELHRIEREHRVRVLYAAESGSRAWGFASRDSDYDVRFVYAHEHGGQGREVPEERADGRIALGGRDVQTALRLLGASHPDLLESLKSPIVYRADPEFALLFGHLAMECLSPERLFRHYLDMAAHHARAYLQTDTLRLKNYFDVLRPLLAARWALERRGPVPMRFNRLTDTLVEDPLARIHIAVLVARKRAGGELDPAHRIPVISGFIEKELGQMQALAPGEAAPAEPGKLDVFFREFCLAEAA